MLHREKSADTVSQTEETVTGTINDAADDFFGDIPTPAPAQETEPGGPAEETEPASPAAAEEKSSSKRGVVAEPNDGGENRDEALFKALKRKKRRKRRRVIITVIIVVLLLAAAAFVAVRVLRSRVTEKVASSQDEVLSYTAKKGSISTTVSGSGTISDVDTDDVMLPANVEVEELTVEAFETVTEGQVLATVKMSSVLSAMSAVQSAIDDLDEELSDAKDDEADEKVKAGIAGRVKIIYAEAETDVITCMYENGALCVLSADGYMAADIPAGQLKNDDSVTVTLSTGKTVSGTVESVSNDTATVIMTDDGPAYGETVTVSDTEGNTLGSAELYIHDPIKVTGFAGTVAYVRTKLNAKVSASTVLFTLKDTAYSAGYESILRERTEQEETLQELLTIYMNGAILAPFSGSVTSVTYDEDTTDTSAESVLVTLSPDKSVSLTIAIDESDIMSLSVGQDVAVTISSIGEDTFAGTVTEVGKSVSSSSGVTRYSCEVTLDKTEQMLAGMSATAVITIEGVEDAIIIPVDALHQTSSTSYVYTTYDSETMQYGGMKEVTTGLSNSSYVEITSGLSEGDTVYYVESSSGFSFSMGSFDFGGSSSSGFSGGDMPSMPSGGGDMPSGGGSSGSHRGGN